MKKLLLLGFSVVIFIFGFMNPVAIDSTPSEGKPRPVEEAEIRAASAQAIKLIQHSQIIWYKKQTCGITALGWATLTNHTDTVEALLARGAQVNHADNRGMTPLLYAASIDFGDTAVIERLIAAGADLKAKNKQGLTALDLANNYHHQMMVPLLAGK